MKKGFTLIELLVVIAIIGILSAVVLTSLNSSRDKAQDTKKVNDVKQIALALELGRSQATGNFVGFADEAAMRTATGVTQYLNPLPADENIAFAAASGTQFCISSALSGSGEFSHYNATEAGSGYANTVGSGYGTANCPIQ